MTALRSFFRLAPGLRALVLEAALLTGAAFLVTRLSPFRWHRQLYGRPLTDRATTSDEVGPTSWKRPALQGLGSGRAWTHDAAVGEGASELEIDLSLKQLRWALNRVKMHWPWDRMCLPIALAGRYMLRRRGYAATLYIGAWRSPEGEVMLHAWLLQKGTPIAGVREARGFRVLAAFE